MKIDSDVPIPVRQRYPFDSFFTPRTGDRKILSLQAAITASAYRHRPKKFSTRCTEEGGIKGVRCWRVE